MDISPTYLPQDMFAPASASNAPKPRVFIAPQRYIQGNGVLDGMGRYLDLVDASCVAILISERGNLQEGPRLLESLGAANVEAVTCIFNGECSLDEIEACHQTLVDEPVDCLLAVGGGKCIDTGKAVAFRLGVPLVVVPTLASNDAPCSAVSVLYTPAGVSSGIEFYPHNPALVVVDSGIVAAAPERYLVAGMGDAMATWYEARVCLLNEAAVTTVGARPTLAACAMGEICAQTLFSDGVAAAAAVAANAVDEPLEKVIEANTLLSGLGFESGGLAAAHGVAQSYTGIASVHANYLHGEMVAMGTLAQLAMESRMDEAARVARFFVSVGLPVHLGQLSLDAKNATVLDTIIAGTLDFPFIGNMPVTVDADTVRRAVLDAHQLGLSIAAGAGDAAYRRLHRA